MGLIVETGAGLANANGYCLVAEATAYHAARDQGDAWDAIDDQESAIVLATDYMEQIYRLRWKGLRTHSTQALSWPRAGVVLADAPYGFFIASDTIPVQVKNACAELALRTPRGALLADLTRGKSSVQIGPIGVTYDRADPQRKRYIAIDALLAPYLTGSATNVRLEAA